MVNGEKDRIQINLARIKKGEDTFEVVVDPDLAVEYQKSKTGDILDVLKNQKVFFDAKKGLLASEENMEARFQTRDHLKVAEIIILEGEIQLSKEYREKIREEKRKQVVSYIATHGVDPKSGHPHPLARIEAAMEEAKVRLNESKSAESQIDDVLKEIRRVLPIKFVVKEIELRIPAVFAAKSYGILKGLGSKKREEWLKDGALLFVIEIPGGLETELYEKVNSLTNGNAEARVLSTR